MPIIAYDRVKNHEEMHISHLTTIIIIRSVMNTMHADTKINITIKTSDLCLKRLRRYVMAELRLKGGVLWFNKLCD